MHQHLQRRTHFCDYLLQTGIFSNPELDQQHEQLYQRILQHYVERYRHRDMFGEPDRATEHSCGQVSQDIDAEVVSRLANKNGLVVQRTLKMNDQPAQEYVLQANWDEDEQPWEADKKLM